MTGSREPASPPDAAEAARAREILKSRARALARPVLRAEKGAETIEVVEFRLAAERYAIERAHVRAVQPLKDLTAIPCTPPFLRGVVNLRGQIIPVLDIKKFFDLPETGITDLHAVVVVRCAEVELGILADSISGVRSIPAGEVQSSLPTLTGIRADYLKGVTADGLVILDAPRILSDPKLSVNEEVES